MLCLFIVWRWDLRKENLINEEQESFYETSSVFMHVEQDESYTEKFKLQRESRDFFILFMLSLDSTAKYTEGKE